MQVSKGIVLNYLPCILSLFFLVAAIGHYFQMDAVAVYAKSWLIGVEMTLLLILIVMIPIQLLVVISFLFTMQWKQLGHGAASLLITALCLFGGVLIDASTIIYAT